MKIRVMIVLTNRAGTYQQYDSLPTAILDSGMRIQGFRYQVQWYLCYHNNGIDNTKFLLFVVLSHQILGTEIPKNWYREYQKFGIIYTKNLVLSVPKIWYSLYQKFGIIYTKNLVFCIPVFWYFSKWYFIGIKYQYFWYNNTI